MEIIGVVEAEFKHLVKLDSDNTLFKAFILKESSSDALKFHITALTSDLKTVYTIKYAKKNAYRVWRLDNAATFLKGLGVSEFRTQFIKDEPQ